MPNYGVRVHGPDLLQAMRTLNANQVPTLGAFAAWRTGDPTTAPSDLQALTAVVDAASLQEAESRVRELLGSDYELEPVEQQEA